MSTVENVPGEAGNETFLQERASYPKGWSDSDVSKCVTVRLHENENVAATSSKGLAFGRTICYPASEPVGAARNAHTRPEAWRGWTLES